MRELLEVGVIRWALLGLLAIVVVAGELGERSEPRAAGRGGEPRLDVLTDRARLPLRVGRSICERTRDTPKELSCARDRSRARPRAARNALRMGRSPSLHSRMLRAMPAQRRRVPRDQSEYLSGFRNQLELLRSASERFDEGVLAEVANLATRIRVLVYDDGRGRSLLRQLGVKERLPYLDTALAEPPPGVISLGAGLCMITATLGVEGSSCYRAPLDNLSPDRQHPPSAFVDWWNDEVLADDIGNSFSRKSLVLAVANQDGGSHFDATLDAAYAALTRDHSLTRFQPAPGGDRAFKNVAPPSVRQIAFELERTLTAEIIEDPADRFGLRVRSPICSLSIHKSITVGRNDPCPCGSGRKRKRCFDLRRPRQRMTMEALLRDSGSRPPAADMGPASR